MLCGIVVAEDSIPDSLHFLDGCFVSLPPHAGPFVFVFSPLSSPLSSPFGTLAPCPPPKIRRIAEKPWALVGLSGCGKTSLASALAASLRIDFYDSDKLVEEQEGVTIAEIFAQKGEAYFRTAELKVIRSLAQDGKQEDSEQARHPFVLACGGGAMAHSATHKVLQSAFTTVWIDCPLPLLERRLASVQGERQVRPLLQDKEQLQSLLKNMEEQRKRHYAKAHARLVVSERDSLKHLVARFDATDDKANANATAKVDSDPAPGKRETDETERIESIDLKLPYESYKIFVGARLLERASSLLPERAGQGKVILVAERKLAPHAELLRQRLQDQGIIVVVVALGISEQQKRLSSVEKLCQRFSEIGADRQSFVVVLGGGVLCDLAAFAASVFMRGIPFALFPTTLLAQVDAAVGGKNGVNSVSGKNMLGVFRQPAAVLCDTDSLTSLPEREMRCGYAEILKYAMIADERFFVWLEAHGVRLLAKEPRVLRQAILHSIRIKAYIVERDEQERYGERALLNFGHTFGHALERLSLYSVAHGEAVAMGCVVATRLAVALGRCKAEVADRLEAHARRCGLPVRLPDLNIGTTRQQQLLLPERWVEAMSQDKKRHAGALRLVLPSKVGKCVLQAPMELKSLRTYLAPILQELAQESTQESTPESTQSSV